MITNQIDLTTKIFNLLSLESKLQESVNLAQEVDEFFHVQKNTTPEELAEFLPLDTEVEINIPNKELLTQFFKDMFQEEMIERNYQLSIRPSVLQVKRGK